MSVDAFRRVVGVAVLTAAVLGVPAENAAADGGADAGAPLREKVEGPKLDALLADISRARKELKTLRARFTQERRITLLATSVTSSGELTCITPDRLRWDLAPPDAIVYFVGPEGLSYKTKSTTATVPAHGPNVARALGDLRALLTGDVGLLRERYALEASRSGSDVEIKGTAKDKNASVRAFALVLDKGLVAPVRARLYEGKTDSIDLAFSSVVINGPVDPAQLRP